MSKGKSLKELKESLSELQEAFEEALKNVPDDKGERILHKDYMNDLAEDMADIAERIIDAS